MTELLYITVKCKKMAHELSHFILSIRACGARPASAQSLCVGTECASGMRRAGGKQGGACAGGGARPVWEVLSAGARGTQHRHAWEAGWMARSVDSLIGSTFGFR
jgi:hypothetical protein